jgi:tetratricopeptide (TPR) repeat protein
VGSYSLAAVARICRVPASRLRRWTRMALLRPEREAPDFDFGDLVAVRRLRGLLERGVPMRQIRRGVQAVRARHPELDRPVAALDVWTLGAPRVVLRAAGVLSETDGQIVLDFAGADGSARVAALGSAAGTAASGARSEPQASEGIASGARSEPQASEGIGRTAAEWFEVGCRLDSERETYADAIDAYQRALAIDPDHADSHCNLGSVYYSQGRRGPARACFERALAVDPGHVEANLNLATMLEEDGRNEPALRHYRRALESDPFYADAHVSAALLYEKLGLRRRAREHWRRYLQIDPGGSWADVARRHFDA